MKPRQTTVRQSGADYEIRIVGQKRTPLRDFYHALLRLPWWATISAISGAFLAANAVFALAYLIVGGVEHAAPGSFADAFFFSVQTMGTIGYGAMYPGSTAANAVVVVESIVSLLLTAISTGIVFAKLSRSRARCVFTRHAVIAPFDGVPTLMFRLGNERGNQIVDAKVQVALFRTERTDDGRMYYRPFDLHLLRDHTLSLFRSWNVLHPIDDASPLRGETPASMAEKEIELQVMVIGLDDVTMQTVHANYRYFTKDILWGARLVDVISETPDGNVLLDLRRFHDVEPTVPTADFPYPPQGTP
ncbi:MAG TPA: ion channel [Burkholderiales bacterium]|nr:ion channel [Burkholderiales bacterium]